MWALWKLILNAHIISFQKEIQHLRQGINGIAMERTEMLQ